MYRREFYTNFLVIEFGAFDIILGMDWISILHVIIDYRMNNFIFQVSYHPNFEFIGGSKTLELA